MGKRKIAILGTAPSWKDAPFEESDWEIWVCNRAGLSQKPWDRLFEIHHDLYYGSEEAEKRYRRQLKNIRPPQQLISVDRLSKSEANIILDRDALFEKYGQMWFSSSFAYMIGFALEMDPPPTDIGFYGVDLESIEELHVQFYAVRHLMDIAKQRGIKLHVAKRSSLLREYHAYPDRFETVLAFHLEEKAADLKKRIRKSQVYLDSARYHAGYVCGQLASLSINDPGYERANKEDDQAQQDSKDWQTAVDILKGQIMAIQHIRRLFCWNVLPPSLGELDEIDAETPGPC